MDPYRQHSSHPRSNYLFDFFFVYNYQNNEGRGYGNEVFIHPVFVTAASHHYIVLS